MMLTLGYLKVCCQQVPCLLTDKYKVHISTWLCSLLKDMVPRGRFPTNHWLVMEAGFTTLKVTWHATSLKKEKKVCTPEDFLPMEETSNVAYNVQTLYRLWYALNKCQMPEHTHLPSYNRTCGLTPHIWHTEASGKQCWEVLPVLPQLEHYNLFRTMKEHVRG